MNSYVGAEPARTQQEYLALLSKIGKLGFFASELRERLSPYFFSPKTYKSCTQLIHSFKESLDAIAPEKIDTIVAVGKGFFTCRCLLSNLNSMKVPIQYGVGADDGPRPPKESQEMASLNPMYNSQ
ncbi:uncharacterized protein TRIADDRAFT_53786 [Trichoplax adhaerens]|uniref:Uncharacterized protein n=1 Tax=Trichoplax adhaerens TaxID=10228 RepID=B3RQ59_TRIAD|nr:hypothetical protein TRIADDRAFT_53786 [Trichoplax adhaerens]EDV27764.1 hypothetical protein TRIADDRAFT_53786 [Trichoplax adhaerens]|eukprot:XP_002109598.1 hypothetical protein TRIADDRAFT_53786 [Trichoplax adhaerens]